MLNSIKVENYKCLKLNEMKLGFLNVFLGLNGSGKSSFLQAVMFAIDSAKLTENPRVFFLQKVFERFDDVLYQYAEDERIILNVGYGDDKQFKIDAERNSYGMDIQEKDFNYNLDYLSPDRLGPTLQHRKMKKNHENNSLVGAHGEGAVAFLHTFGNSIKVPKKLHHPLCEEDSLLAQVNAWLSEISPGAKLNLSSVPVLDDVLLQFKFDLDRETTTPFKPENVGWGISYIVPVLTLLLSSHWGTDKTARILIIESPEAHIHPKGQAALGRLMALTASSSVQLFIETHSDHVINGIRVAAKQKLIDNKDVNLSFFERKTAYSSEGVEEQFSDLTRIIVDRNGELDNYPSDFLDQWNTHLMELI